MLGKGPVKSEFGRYGPAHHLNYFVKLHQHLDRTPNIPSRPSIMLYPIFREKLTSQRPVDRALDGNPASIAGAGKIMRLPNELLVQIWSYMSRKDIESLSLVNRHFHNLGRQYIQEHRRLKQRYQRVQNPLPYGHKSRVAKGRFF